MDPERFATWTVDGSWTVCGVIYRQFNNWLRVAWKTIYVYQEQKQPYYWTLEVFFLKWYPGLRMASTLWNLLLMKLWNSSEGCLKSVEFQLYITDRRAKPCLRFLKCSKITYRFKWRTAKLVYIIFTWIIWTKTRPIYKVINLFCSKVLKNLFKYDFSKYFTTYLPKRYMMVIFKTMNDLPTQFRHLFVNIELSSEKIHLEIIPRVLPPRRKTPTGTNSLA